jgi:hypothetical protein
MTHRSHMRIENRLDDRCQPISCVLDTKGQPIFWGVRKECALFRRLVEKHLYPVKKGVAA